MLRPLCAIPLLALALALAATGTTGAPPAVAAERVQVPPAAGRPMGAAEAKALLGHTVTTSDGGDAGSIHDFVLSGPGGTVERAILATGGVLGVGSRLVQVPADRLRIGVPTSVPKPGEAPSLVVTLDLTARELAQASAFVYDDGVLTLTGGR